MVSMESLLQNDPYELPFKNEIQQIQPNVFQTASENSENLELLKINIFIFKTKLYFALSFIYDFMLAGK